MGNTTTKESAVYHKLTKLEKDKIEELKQIYPNTFIVRIVNKKGQVLAEHTEDNKEIKNLSLPEALQSFSILSFIIHLIFCFNFFFFTHTLFIITSFLIVDCLSSDETPRILRISGSKSMFTLVGFTDDDTKVIFSFYLFHLKPFFEIYYSLYIFVCHFCYAVYDRSIRML